LARVNVHHSREQFAACQLKDQFRTTARSEFRHFRIGTAAESRGGFRVQFQKACRAADRYGLKPGAFDENIFRREGNFRFAAAHDSAEAHGARTVSVAYHPNAWTARTIAA